MSTNISQEIYEILIKTEGEEEAQQKIAKMKEMMELLGVQMKSENTPFLKKVYTETKKANAEINKMDAQTKKLTSALKRLSSVSFANLAGIKGLDLSKFSASLSEQFKTTQIGIEVNLKTEKAISDMRNFNSLLLKRNEITQAEFDRIGAELNSLESKFQSSIHKMLTFTEPIRKAGAGVRSISNESAKAFGFMNSKFRELKAGMNMNTFNLMNDGFKQLKIGAENMHLEEKFDKAKSAMLEFINIQERAGNYTYSKSKKGLESMEFNAKQVNAELLRMKKNQDMVSKFSPLVNKGIDTSSKFKSWNPEEENAMNQQILNQRVNAYNQIQAIEQRNANTVRKNINDEISMRNMLNNLHKKHLLDRQKYLSADLVSKGITDTAIARQKELELAGKQALTQRINAYNQIQAIEQRNANIVRKNINDEISMRNMLGNLHKKHLLDRQKYLSVDLVSKGITDTAIAKQKELELAGKQALIQRVNAYEVLKSKEEERARIAIATEQRIRAEALKTQKERSTFLSRMAGVKGQAGIGSFGLDTHDLLDKNKVEQANLALEKQKADLTRLNEEMLRTEAIGRSAFTKNRIAIGGMSSEITEASLKADRLNTAFKGLSGTNLNPVGRSIFGIKTEARKLQETMEKLGQAAALKKQREEYMKNLAIVKKYGDLTEKEFEQLSAKIRTATLDMKNFGKSGFNTMTKMGELTSKYRAIFVNLTRAFIAVQVGKQFIQWVDGIEKLKNAIFQLESFEGFSSIKSQLDDLDSVTGGMLNKYKIIQSTNKAIDLGVDLTNGKLLKLSRMVTIIGQKYGVDSTKMFEDFTVAIGKANPIVLDNIGVILKKEQAYKRYFDRVYLGTQTFNDWLNSLRQTKKNAIYMEEGLRMVEQKTQGFTVNISESQTAMAQMSQAWSELSLNLADTGGINIIVSGFKAVTEAVLLASKALVGIKNYYVVLHNMVSDNKIIPDNEHAFLLAQIETGKLNDKNKALLKTKSMLLSKNKEILDLEEKGITAVRKNLLGLEAVRKKLNTVKKDILGYMQVDQKKYSKKDIDDLDKKIALSRKYIKLKERELSLLPQPGDTEDTLGEKQLALSKSLGKEIVRTGSVWKMFKSFVTDKSQFVTMKEHIENIKVTGAAVGDVNLKLKKNKEFRDDINKQMANLSVVQAGLNREYNKSSVAINDYARDVKNEVKTRIDNAAIMRINASGLVDENQAYVRIGKAINYVTDERAKQELVYDSSHKKRAQGFIDEDKMGRDAVKRMTGMTAEQYASNEKLGFSIASLGKKTVDWYNTINASPLEQVFGKGSKALNHYSFLLEKGKMTNQGFNDSVKTFTPVLDKAFKGRNLDIKKLAGGLALMQGEINLSTAQMRGFILQWDALNKTATRAGARGLNLISFLIEKFKNLEQTVKKTGRTLKDVMLDWEKIVRRAYVPQLNPATQKMEQARFAYEENLKMVKKYFLEAKKYKLNPVSPEERKQVEAWFKNIYDMKVKALVMKSPTATELKIKYDIEFDESLIQEKIKKANNFIKKGFEGLSDVSMKDEFFLRSLADEFEYFSGKTKDLNLNFIKQEDFKAGTENAMKVAGAYAFVQSSMEKLDDTSKLQLNKSLREINEKWIERKKVLEDNILISNLYQNKEVMALGLNKKLIKSISDETLSIKEKKEILEKYRLKEIENIKRISDEKLKENKIKALGGGIDKVNAFLLKERLSLQDQYIDRQKKIFSLSQTHEKAGKEKAFELTNPFSSIIWSEAEQLDQANKYYKEVFNKAMIGLGAKGDLKGVEFDKGIGEFVINPNALKGKTDAQIKIIKDAVSKANAIAKDGANKFDGIFKNSTDAITGHFKEMGKQVVSSLITMAGNQVWKSMVTDKAAALDMTTQLTANKDALKKDLEERNITEADYNEKLLKLDADFAFKKRQAEAQGERDRLIGLGSMFFAQGLAYVAAAPAKFFEFGPAAALAYAGSGAALMMLGKHYGSQGAGVTVPMQGASSSTTRAAQEDTKDMNIYIDNQVYRDRRHLDRVASESRYTI